MLIQELLEKYNIKLDIDAITNNMDPFSICDQMREVNDHYSKMVFLSNRLKNTEKKLAGEIYLKYKNSGEKFSEKSIESIIATSIDILDVRDQIAEVTALVSYLDGLREILRFKLTIINSLMADRRKGLENE